MSRSAQVTIDANAPATARQVSLFSPAGPSNVAAFTITAAPPAGGLMISNLTLDGAVPAQGQGIIFSGGFNFTGAQGRVTYESGDCQLARSARIEVSLKSKSSANTGVCEFRLGGAPLNFPGADQGRFDVPALATNTVLAQDLVTSGNGTVSVTLIDRDGNRSNIENIDVPAEPAPGQCLAGAAPRVFALDPFSCPL